MFFFLLWFWFWLNVSNGLWSRWQDASLSYDPESPLAEIQSDAVFREGQTLGGQVTYTPRLISMDLKGTERFGSPGSAVRPVWTRLFSVCLHRKSADSAAGGEPVRPGSRKLCRSLVSSASRWQYASGVPPR